jgi:DNA-binding Lrp family transcriptional regulator
VPRLIPRTTDIDIDLFREMYHGGGVTIAGFDPRLNASRLAARLGVSRAKVSARLREWTEYGLIERLDVWPNPSLVHRVGFTVDVRLADRLRKPELFERVALLDGIVGGIDFVGEWVSLQFAVRAPEDIPRTARLLRGLAGIAEVAEPIPWAQLGPAQELRPLDRRIVRVLRDHPRESLSVIARHVGVSTRTITTRYGKLVEDLAVWFVPVLDFRALSQPVVSVLITLENEALHGSTARAFRKEYPQSLELIRAGFGPLLPGNVAVFFAILPSVARLEEIERFTRDLPGVQAVETYVLVRILSFPETFDRLMNDGPADAGARSPAPNRRRTPR